MTEQYRNCNQHGDDQSINEQRHECESMERHAGHTIQHTCKPPDDPLVFVQTKRLNHPWFAFCPLQEDDSLFAWEGGVDEYDGCAIHKKHTNTKACSWHRIDDLESIRYEAHGPSNSTCP